MICCSLLRLLSVSSAVHAMILFLVSELESRLQNKINICVIPPFVCSIWMGIRIFASYKRGSVPVPHAGWICVCSILVAFSYEIGVCSRARARVATCNKWNIATTWTRLMANIMRLYMQFILLYIRTLLLCSFLLLLLPFFRFWKFGRVLMLVCVIRNRFAPLVWASLEWLSVVAVAIVRLTCCTNLPAQLQFQLGKMSRVSLEIAHHRWYISNLYERTGSVRQVGGRCI